MAMLKDRPAAAARPPGPPGPRPVTREAWNALWGSALGYAMDGFDLLILGFMLRAIAAGLGLSPAQAASAASPTTLTAVDSTSGFGINFDVLDEAPPSADNGWSSLSGGGSAGRQLGRRLTFGTVSRSTS